MSPAPLALSLLAAVAAPALQAPCSAPAIASVEIVRHEVFDDGAGGLYRLANKAHVVTRESVVHSELLFGAGDVLDVEALEQTERNLRQRPFLREVAIEVLDAEGRVLAMAGQPALRELACAAGRPDEVRVRVTTRDSWSTSLEGSMKQAGDRTLWSIGLSESNFLGRGKELELSHDADIDRSANVVAYRDPRLLGGDHTLEAIYADQSDGSRGFFRLARPIFALDTEWAWSVRSEVFDQVQPLYRRGERHRELRHVRRHHELELSRLLSRSDRVALRLEAAYRSLDDEVAGAPREFGIFEVGLRRIEHRYRKLSHIRHERPDDINLGGVSSVRLGLSPGGFGGRDRALFLRAEHRQGAALGDRSFLIGSGGWSGRLREGRVENGLLEARLSLLRFVGARQLLLTSARLTDGTRLDPERQLTLGAQNGLRGYAVHRFTGDRTLLASAEFRWFLTDDLWRLLSVGVTAFADVGITWQAPAGAGTDGMRRNLGVGLLLGRKSLSTRNAALRIDLAYALDPVLDRGRWLLSFQPVRLDL